MLWKWLKIKKFPNHCKGERKKKQKNPAFNLVRRRKKCPSEQPLPGVPSAAG